MHKSLSCQETPPSHSISVRHGWHWGLFRQYWVLWCGHGHLQDDRCHFYWSSTYGCVYRFDGISYRYTLKGVVTLRLSKYTPLVSWLFPVQMSWYLVQIPPVDASGGCHGFFCYLLLFVIVFVIVIVIVIIPIFRVQI